MNRTSLEKWFVKKQIELEKLKADLKFPVYQFKSVGIATGFYAAYFFGKGYKTGIVF